MGKPRYGARRDVNHADLVNLAIKLGARYLPDGPFDGWINPLERWYLIEIKDPKKEGWASEYTEAQRRLIKRGIKPDVVLRTDDDVLRFMGAKVSA